MNDIMQQIVNYYQNYKNDIIPNDDLIAIIFNFKIMASIEKIDDMIINKYGDNMTDRLDFYNHIYHHHIMDIIIKQIEYKDDKNYFIISMIFIELHKCNLTNHIIESSTEQTVEDNIAAQAKLIKQKKMYSKMITKLVELADKEKEMYSNIIDLVETNKHMYN
jgi:hypothetical protein